MNARNSSCWADTWQAECERAAFNAAALMRVARRFPNNAAILEIVRSAPRSPDEEQDPNASPFMRCLRAARIHAQPYEDDLLCSVIEYFQELASMKPARRALLEASLTGVLTGLGMEGDAMLTPKQVAARVGVSDSLVYEWCAQGLLKHYRFGGKGNRGCIRIEEVDLNSFLASCLHEVQPIAPPLKHIKLSHG